MTHTAARTEAAENPPPQAALLRSAAALLAAGDDEGWDGLLPIVERLEQEDPQAWQDLAVAVLEAMVASNVREALERDPWSSAAPLVTRLLRRLAHHVPAQPRRAVLAIRALFDQLRAAEPITMPDGLPGAVAALVEALPSYRTPLVTAFAQMVDGQRLRALLACQRTTRRELRSLRRAASDQSLAEAIDEALGGAPAVSGTKTFAR